jgi:hypothetical protein
LQVLTIAEQNKCRQAAKHLVVLPIINLLFMNKKARSSSGKTGGSGSKGLVGKKPFKKMSSQNKTGKKKTLGEQ